MMGVQAGLLVARSARPMHGATKSIVIKCSDGIFAGLPGTVRMGCYHSLVVAQMSRRLNPGWRVTATCDQGEVMGLEFGNGADALTAGVQFHPESFLSKESDAMADNWIRSVRLWYGLRRQKAR